MKNINTKDIMEDYIRKKDWRVTENSTVSYSIGGSVLSNAEAIQSRYWLTEVYDEDIAQAHKNADIHIHDLGWYGGYCFTGDTRVKMLDGSSKSFIELVRDYKDKSFYVYSVDKDGYKTIGIAHTPRKTRVNSELVNITLDNGEEIRCTPDHKILLRNNIYCEAKDLKIGTSLMTYYTPSIGKGYKAINTRGKKSYAHRFIMEKILGIELLNSEVVHHIDGNKSNNDPSNLEVISDTEHKALEIKKNMQTEIWKNNNNIRLVKYNKSEEKRNAISELALKRERDEQGRFYNSKVTKIELLDYKEDVYDITVDKYHNFALDNGVVVHNCAGWSLLDLIKKGLVSSGGRVASAPAKHLSTLTNQMVNYIGIMANEWAGAQAFSSFDTYLSPFVKKDNMKYKEIKQAIQSFIFGLNFPNRWGSQAPFSNITLDWIVPVDLADLKAIVGGIEQDFTYGECQNEMNLINKAFLEIMIEGDANDRGFQYPIPTYNITKDFDWDTEKENNKLLFEMTAKYGTPYFSNYINSDMDPSDVRSMCCRLRLDLRELEKKNGGFFGAGENTGSIGVVTLNLPRYAYISNSKEEFYSNLEKNLNIAKRSLDIKRKVLSVEFNNGLYPYTMEYLEDFSNHFSTIGLIGGNEACLNSDWVNGDIRSQEGQVFILEIFNFIKNKLSDFQEETGFLYNLEATPAESTTYRFAKHDRNKYKNIITAGEDGETPYYTNSTHLPVGYTEDIFDALDIQDQFQVEYTSGTVFHGFIGEKISDWETAMRLVKVISENYKLPYYTISPTYSICKTHGYLDGEVPICKYCGEHTEIYSRITGYYRSVGNWNDGKVQEFHDRKEYEIK